MAENRGRSLGIFYWKIINGFSISSKTVSEREHSYLCQSGQLSKNPFNIQIRLYVTILSRGLVKAPGVQSSFSL